MLFRPTWLRSFGLISAGFLPFLLAGCPQPPGGNPGGGDPALTPFGSANEFLDYFKQQATPRSSNRSLFDYLAAPMADAAPQATGAETSAGAGANDASGSTAFTGTNIQEAGVDESDVVKSDGTYLYIAKRGSLRIVRANPASDLAEVGRLDLDAEATADSIYLFGSKVILLAQRYGVGYSPGGAELMIWPPYYQNAGTVVYEIDVADPTKPTLRGKNELDGSLVTSRLTRERLVLILTAIPNLPSNPTPLAVAAMQVGDVLPKTRTSGGAGLSVDWPNVLRPNSPDGYYMTLIVTLDANNVEQIVSSTGVMANAGTIYASPEALYLTDTNYDSNNGYREQTAIHKFRFDENGVARYVASGLAPGRLLNQFSLGEHQDFLRLATHVDNVNLIIDPIFLASDGIAGQGEATQAASADDNVSSEPSSPDDVPSQPLPAPPPRPTAPYNAVFVLGESNGKLEIKGAIQNIAPGEQLYSARFMGERGFLVTFRQVDPLFVVDLKNPAAPQIAGELKIPGYSDYLHPLDDNHLIGVGQAVVVNEFGGALRDGLQLSLFDVTDWANPKVVQQLTVGGRGSHSDVSYTHKAFTFLPEQNLLAIPAQLYAKPNNIFDFYGNIAFDGILCYRVDPANGFTELGRVATVAEENSDPFFYPYAEWRRAAFIGEVAYAISPSGVRAAALANFNTTTTVKLAPDPQAVGQGGGAAGFEGRPAP